MGYGIGLVLLAIGVATFLWSVMSPSLINLDRDADRARLGGLITMIGMLVIVLRAFFDLVIAMHDIINRVA